MVTYSMRHQGTHYGDMYTWIIWRQKIQKNYGFFLAKGGHNRGCIWHVWTLLQFMDTFSRALFPMPPFPDHPAKNRTHIVTLSAFIARHELFNPLNCNAAVKVLDQWLPIAEGFKAHITGICILELFYKKKSKKTMDFFSQKVVTTEGVFDMCEFCYSSLIRFQEHCFPCPLFHTAQLGYELT